MIRRRRNLDGYMEGGVFHPIRGSEGYDDERLGDTGFSFGANDPAERKKAEREEKQRERWEYEQRQKELAARKKAARLGRHTFTGAGEDDYTQEGLAHFVRRMGGIRTKPGDPFEGEVDRLSPTETGTTGLIRRVGHKRGGLHRGYDNRGGLTAEYMRDAAVEHNLIGEDVSIDGFLGMVEDSVALERKGAKRRNSGHYVAHYEIEGSPRIFNTLAAATRAARQMQKKGAPKLAIYRIQLYEPATRVNPKQKRKPLAREFGESDTGTQPRLFIMGDKKHAGQETMEALFAEGEKMPAKKNAWSLEKHRGGLSQAEYLAKIRAAKKKRMEREIDRWTDEQIRETEKKNPISAQRVRRKAKAKPLRGVSPKTHAQRSLSDAQMRARRRRKWAGEPSMTLWEKTPRKRNFKISAAGKLRIGKNPTVTRQRNSFKDERLNRAWYAHNKALERYGAGSPQEKAAGRKFDRLEVGYRKKMEALQKAEAAKAAKATKAYRVGRVLGGVLKRKRKNVSIKVGGRSKFRATKKGVTIGGRVTLKANPRPACQRCGSVADARTGNLINVTDDYSGERLKICGHCFKHGDYTRTTAAKRKANPSAERAAGGWRVSDMIDGYRVSKLYLGYTKAQAIKRFRADHAASKNPGMAREHRLYKAAFNAIEKWSHAPTAANERKKDAAVARWHAAKGKEILRTRARSRSHDAGKHVYHSLAAKQSRTVDRLTPRKRKAASKNPNFRDIEKFSALSAKHHKLVISGPAKDRAKHAKLRDEYNAKAARLFAEWESGRKAASKNPGGESRVWRLAKAAHKSEAAYSRFTRAHDKAQGKAKARPRQKVVPVGRIFLKKEAKRKAAANPNLFETFHGRRATKENVLNAPDGTPKRLDKLGKLVSLHAEGGTIKPRATVWLCADSKGKLHLCTSAARLIDGGPQNFGQVKKIEYETTKNHLDGKPTIYYHHFGEEGGSRPTLHSDGRGGLKLKGGAYKIRAEGIRN